MDLHPRAEERCAYLWVGWRRLLRKWVCCWTFLLESQILLGVVLFVGIMEILEGGKGGKKLRREGEERSQCRHRHCRNSRGRHHLSQPGYPFCFRPAASLLLLVTNNNYDKRIDAIVTMHATHFANCYRN